MDKVLITGSSNGIGKALAAAFAEVNFFPIVHGRSKESCILSLQDVWRVSKTNATFYLADLMNKEELKSFIDRIKEDEISGLILNAGSYFPKPKFSYEIEATILLNYLSRYILLAELLPLISQQKNPFVIDISGKYHRKGKFQNIYKNTPVDFNWQDQINASKLANVCLIHHLRALPEFSHIKMMTIHPGAVQNDQIAYDSRLSRKDRLLYKTLSGFFMKAGKSAKMTLELFKADKWEAYAEDGNFTAADLKVSEAKEIDKLLSWSAEQSNALGFKALN